MCDNKAPENRFYDNIVSLSELVHELISDCYEAGVTNINPTLVVFVGGFLKAYDRTETLHNFIKYSYEHWDQINERDVEFFAENCTKIFGDLPMNHVNSFRVLYDNIKDNDGEEYITEDDINSIFDYFHSLIKIAIKYIHNGRKPKVVTGKNGTKPVYQNKFFTDVDIEKYAALYKVKLVWA